MIKSRKVGNWQASQGLLSFFVIDSNNTLTSEYLNVVEKNSNLKYDSCKIPKDQTSLSVETPVIDKEWNTTSETDSWLAFR